MTSAAFQSAVLAFGCYPRIFLEALAKQADALSDTLRLQIVEGLEKGREEQAAIVASAAADMHQINRHLKAADRAHDEQSDRAHDALPDFDA